MSVKAHHEPNGPQHCASGDFVTRDAFIVAGNTIHRRTFYFFLALSIAVFVTMTVAIIGDAVTENLSTLDQTVLDRFEFPAIFICVPGAGRFFRNFSPLTFGSFDNKRIVGHCDEGMALDFSGNFEAFHSRRGDDLASLCAGTCAAPLMKDCYNRYCHNSSGTITEVGALHGCFHARDCWECYPNSSCSIPNGVVTRDTKPAGHGDDYLCVPVWTADKAGISNENEETLRKLELHQYPGSECALLNTDGAFVSERTAERELFFEIRQLKVEDLSPTMEPWTNIYTVFGFWKPGTPLFDESGSMKTRTWRAGFGNKGINVAMRLDSVVDQRGRRGWADDAIDSKSGGVRHDTYDVTAVSTGIEMAHSHFLPPNGSFYRSLMVANNKSSLEVTYTNFAFGVSSFTQSTVYIRRLPIVQILSLLGGALVTASFVVRGTFKCEYASSQTASGRSRIYEVWVLWPWAIYDLEATQRAAEDRVTGLANDSPPTSRRAGRGAHNGTAEQGGESSSMKSALSVEGGSAPVRI